MGPRGSHTAGVSRVSSEFATRTLAACHCTKGGPRIGATRFAVLVRGSVQRIPEHVRHIESALERPLVSAE